MPWYIWLIGLFVYGNIGYLYTWLHIHGIKKYTRATNIKKKPIYFYIKYNVFAMICFPGNYWFNEARKNNEIVIDDSDDDLIKPISIQSYYLDNDNDFLAYIFLSTILWPFKLLWSVVINIFAAIIAGVILTLVPRIFIFTSRYTWYIITLPIRKLLPKIEREKIVEEKTNN